ncbi:MAG: glycosyltransferase family 2 protein [Acidimicrobiales bacterium]|nr:glycosyltransferase family 2 protein [Acidimicrobiales bacterium]
MLSVRHVDIGLPVYNGGRYLASALESLLSQTHEDLSIWISDNGSIDDTADIAKAFAVRDERVHYECHPENRGAAWNFEHVRVFANGAYFKWAAHDDLHEPTYLIRCIEALEAAPDAVIAQPRTVFIDDTDQELLRSFRVNDWDHPDPAVRLRTVLGRNHEYGFAFGLIRTEALRELDEYRARYGADELLLSELALRGRFIEVDEHLFRNRLHPNRSMVQNSGLRYRLLWNDWWSGAGGGGSKFPAWRFLVDLRDIIDRAPLDDAQRRACRRVLIEWSRNNWSRLGLDVPLGVEQILRSRAGS